MVDVGDKKITDRTAIARAIVFLGKDIVKEITDNGFQTKKGPVFQVASLAGIMATKRTSDLIPLCHPLALNKANVDIEIISDSEAQVECLVKTSGKTGVEMEALTGASVAALTIYDMCKAMSHKIEIKEVKLIHKSGGKKDFDAKPLKALVLAGGKSERMGKDKGGIDYHGKGQAEYMYDMLQEMGIETYISCRSDQSDQYKNKAQIHDTFIGLGPFGAIASACMSDPNAAWIVIPCDLPLLENKHIETLTSKRNPYKYATAFLNNFTQFPEPLISIWEPKIYQRMLCFLSQGYSCPRKVLINSDVELIYTENQDFMMNINTPEEMKKVNVIIQER
ncbi:UNVERIFIED_CONTAM: hypothetical protein GTU68_048134 [Idotea baltica]|nr:hypothetical protein [Idotea baltica]